MTDTPDEALVERAVMVCPQCEGEGGYPDGLDEAACHTECTRCGSNGWIVDRAALATLPAAAPADDLENALTRTARKNICTYIENASFRCEVDREAALACVQVLTDEIDGLGDLVAVLRSAIAAMPLVALPKPAEQGGDVVGDRAELIEHLSGPHEWGYRCLAEGGFIEDDKPFEAATALAARDDEIEALRGKLDELQKAEAAYRYAHDILGSGDSKTGRAWDLMRRAGDAARALLAPATGEAGN